MTVTLVPLPDGLDGDEPNRLQEIIHAINGYAGQGIRFNLTAYRHDERYAVQIRNQGTTGGGLHLGVWASNASLSVADPIFEVQDAGVFATVPVEFASTLTVDGNLSTLGDLTVLGDATVHGVIAGDSGLDLIGGAEISGTVILHNQLQSTVSTGTAPFTVASTTVVTNLNADLLDGFHASHFVTLSDLANYVLKAGDTMTGLLTMEPSTPTDIAIKLKNSSAGNGMTIGTGTGSNDGFAPALIVRDHLGTDMLEVGNSATSVYYATVKGGLHVQGVADFDSDMVLGNSSSDTITVPGTTDFQAGLHVSAGSVNIQNGTAGQLKVGALIANATSLFGSEALRVVGSSRLEGSVTVTTGGIGVTGSSSFNSGISVAGGYSQSTGNFTLPNTSLGFFGGGAAAKQTVTGSRGGNAALASLLTALATYGLVTDSSSA